MIKEFFQTVCQDKIENFLYEENFTVCQMVQNFKITICALVTFQK